MRSNRTSLFLCIIICNLIVLGMAIINIRANERRHTIGTPTVITCSTPTPTFFGR